MHKTDLLIHGKVDDVALDKRATNLLVAAFFTCFSGEVEVIGFCFTEDPAAESCFLGFVFPLSAKTSEACVSMTHTMMALL